MKSLKKSQSSTELIILLSVILIIFLAMFAVNQEISSSMSDRLTAIKARNALDEIANNAELIYYEGYGAAFNIYIDLPQGIKNTSVLGTSIKIILDDKDSTVIFKNLPFEVVGEIPLSPGVHSVGLRSKGDEVMIGYAMVSFYPYSYSETIAAGSSVSRNIELENLLENDLNVELSFSGSAMLDVDLNETSFTIYEKQTENVGIDISVLAGASSGDYEGDIIIECEDPETSEERTYLVEVDVAVP